VLEWQLSDLKKKAAIGTTKTGPAPLQIFGPRYVSPWWFALAYARVGLKKEAIHSLEAAYKEHASRLVWLQHESDLDFMHADERYRAILRKMGLPSAF
jgi:hypothetical protein